jgi:hypothetical protein
MLAGCRPTSLRKTREQGIAGVSQISWHQSQVNISSKFAELSY